MMTHLLKRCPNMTQEDRNILFIHMQQNGSNGTAKAKKQAVSDQHNTQDVGYAQPQMPITTDPGLNQQRLPDFPPVEHRHHVQQQMQHGVQQGLPPNSPLHMLTQREQSALDTLAEVSRRHMDYSGQNHGYGGDLQQPDMLRQSNRVLVEQALMVALQQQDVNGQMTQIAPSTMEPISLSIYGSYEPQAQMGAEQPIFTNNQISMPLSQDTALPGRQIEHDHYEPNVESIDPQLETQVEIDDQPPPEMDCEPPQQPQTDIMTWTENPQDFVTQQDPPSNDPNPEFSVLHKPDKTNARARFTDTRRKEVQQIRKRGACMRCRMLKKPCSDGTPCGTCKKVDSARLWKGTCLRTKLAEEFLLYSTSYFHSQTVKCFANNVRGMTHAPIPGRVEVALVPNYTLVMTLGLKRYLGSPNANNDQGVSSNRTPLVARRHDVVVLDDEMASQKISEYCMKDAVIDACIENEGSIFLQATLRESKTLLEAERSRQAPSNQKSTSRTNPISPSALLTNVIELWIETNILISNPQQSLHVRYNPSKSAQAQVWPDDATPSSFTLPLDPRSLGLIHSQLMAATESACHRLSKAVMNELERRLLQRQQVSAFATFISAVILFNCIERITGFYHSLDPSPVDTITTTLQDPSFSVPPHQPSDIHPPDHPPTASPPSTRWSQGPHFARLLTTLLRMRALPPRTNRTADNKLAVLQEPGPAVKLNGVAVREQQDADTVRAANWLDHLCLDVDDLRAKRDGDVAVNGWEMKFISDVLLGEGL
jgi:hypothetical protein